jgi:hypothetical protein
VDRQAVQQQAGGYLGTCSASRSRSSAAKWCAISRSKRAGLRACTGGQSKCCVSAPNKRAKQPVVICNLQQVVDWQQVCSTALKAHCMYVAS